MFWIGIGFLLLVWIFGFRVFTVMRWILGFCILAVIALLVFASLHPAKQEPAATPLVKSGFLTDDALNKASPTPTVTANVKLLDYGFDEGSSPDAHKTKTYKRSHI
jgi:hypothetical protein